MSRSRDRCFNHSSCVKYERRYLRDSSPYEIRSFFNRFSSGVNAASAKRDVPSRTELRATFVFAARGAKELTPSNAKSEKVRAIAHLAVIRAHILADLTRLCKTAASFVELMIHQREALDFFCRLDEGSGSLPSDLFANWLAK